MRFKNLLLGFKKNTEFPKFTSLFIHVKFLCYMLSQSKLLDRDGGGQIFGNFPH